jgi:hypothetical protein
VSGCGCGGSSGTTPGAGLPIAPATSTQARTVASSPVPPVTVGSSAAVGSGSSATAAAAVPITANFALGEFQRASTRVLHDSDVPAITTWATQILQPARNALGRIRITSYIRHTDHGRAHENGGGIDVVTLDRDLGESFDWMRQNLRGRFGRIIFERNHIHLARRGPEPWAGDGVELVEPVEGRYQLATILPAVEIVAPVAELVGDPFAAVVGRQPTSWETAGLVLLLLALGAYLLTRKAGVGFLTVK